MVVGIHPSGVLVSLVFGLGMLRMMKKPSCCIFDIMYIR